MKSKTKIILIAFGIIVVGVAIYYLYGFYKSIRPALLPPVENIAAIENSTQNLGLSLPAGFKISIFAKDLAGARVMIFDNAGNIWLSQTSQGIVSQIIIKDGKFDSQKIVLSGLQNPHGLAFDPENQNVLYVAEETKISKVVLSPTGDGKLQKIIDLPTGGNHFTRTLGFGPDGRLYVSMGSTCNVCVESDPRYASIYSFKKDGSDFLQVAKGLRNSVFFAWNQKDGKMWATEMGRDLLGDNLPPDEINIIEEGKNYGWPICYGKNIHDTNFDKNTYIRNPCLEPFETPSYIDIQAHSAPLGLAFFPEEGWPEEYWHNLLVAYHGSWNRSEPTGYKIVRYRLDSQGKPLGPAEDFITGWLKDGGASGRPVDILIQPGGVIYVSDDKAGVIYKIIKN